MNIPDEQFYDKVAQKFGGYKTGAIRKTIFSDKDPEQIFFDQLLKFADKNKIALDIGCADGRFTLKTAPHFKQVFGIDISSKMLARAKQFQDEQKISNIIFQKADANQLPFQDGYFDVIYSRRGPSPYREISRTIKPGGHYLEICIGEKDAQELKKVFGRGQDFGKWNTSAAKVKKRELEMLSFKTIFVHDYFYSEFYPDIENFNLFLQGVPIFKDFDPVKDKDFIFSYIHKMKAVDGIELKRHRIIIVAEKEQL